MDKINLNTWREKYPDILKSKAEAKELLREVKESLLALPKNQKAEYLRNFSKWGDDRHRIAEYVLFFAYDAIFFHQENRDKEKPDHPVLKEKSLNNIQYEMKIHGTLEVWEKYGIYFPPNRSILEKNNLFSMCLLLDILEIYYSLSETSVIKSDPARPLQDKIEIFIRTFKPEGEENFEKKILAAIENNILFFDDKKPAFRKKQIGEIHFTEIEVAYYFWEILYEEKIIPRLEGQQINNHITFNFHFEGKSKKQIQDSLNTARNNHKDEKYKILKSLI